MLINREWIKYDTENSSCTW